jgi:hypothetical protein
MDFQIDYDKNGNPDRVHEDTGFCLSSRAFNPDTDGWMLDQLDPENFPEISTGRRVLHLVQEVNSLRREVWRLKRLQDIGHP